MTSSNLNDNNVELYGVGISVDDNDGVGSE